MESNKMFKKKTIMPQQSGIVSIKNNLAFAQHLKKYPKWYIPDNSQILYTFGEHRQEPFLWPLT